MKLLTQEVRQALPPLYSQEENPDPIVPVKFFCPWNQWTWYAYEGAQEDPSDPDSYNCFGYVVGDYKELGYFNVAELQTIRGPAGLGIERDLRWTPKPLSEVKKLHGDA